MLLTYWVCRYQKIMNGDSPVVAVDGRQCKYAGKKSQVLIQTCPVRCHTLCCGLPLRFVLGVVHSCTALPEMRSLAGPCCRRGR
jgi:hypothetical protein